MRGARRRSRAALGSSPSPSAPGGDGQSHRELVAVCPVDGDAVLDGRRVREGAPTEQQHGGTRRRCRATALSLCLKCSRFEPAPLVGWRECPACQPGRRINRPALDSNITPKQLFNASKYTRFATGCQQNTRSSSLRDNVP